MVDWICRGLTSREKPVVLSLRLPKVPKLAFKLPPELGRLNSALAFQTGGDQIFASNADDNVAANKIRFSASKG